MGYSPTEYAEFTEPPTEMSSHGFLLRRVWHLAIPTPPAMGSSPTEYAEFTEPPTEMSSHGFLLRRVWHLAIPTPPAMGYSPTEYAEFTEPPAEKSLPRISQIYTDVRVRCSPTEFTEFTEFGSVGMAGMPYPPTSVRIRAHLWEALLCQKFLCVPCVLWEYLFSHGFHRFTQILRVRCSPTEFIEFTEFGSVGMAGMPYPPTSVRIRVICGSPFSARGSVYSVHSVGASSPLVRLVQQRQLHPLA